MIYTSVYFTMIYKDSQKLEKTRKHRKPMPHNQGVPGSSPGGTTYNPSIDSVEGLLFPGVSGLHFTENIYNFVAVITH